MDYIRFCIDNPVKVTVGVLIVLLLGMIALFAIPVQLTPDIDQPRISVETNWVGRSPEEVEREIIEKQEEKLKGVTNLRKLKATAYQGRAEILLEFYIGTDMTRVLQEVSDKLREVEEYADEVKQPVIVAADSAVENPIAWMVLTSDDPNFHVESIYTEVDKRVKPILERVAGVSQINIYGGLQREVHIQIDPQRMAERGITFNALRHALQQENVNISAGDLAEGRKDIRIRTKGAYENNVEEIKQTIVAYTAGGPVRVKDLGQVELTLEKQRAFVHSKGQSAMAINAIRETGANVVEVMQGLRKQVALVNDPERGVLRDLGPGLHLTQVYDETIYIEDALALVIDNLWQGGLLAIIILVVFLRKIRPTFIISLAIPLSVIGTFVALAALGRNLNVVSLAGLAFAVGMVVDNAIVVLENTDRHLGMGKTPMRAAYEATREVWAAVLASTMTTLIVFLPVIFMQEEAGQLFRDISLAVCAAVALSLVVAVTVIPSAAARLLKPHQPRKHQWAKRADSLFGLGNVLGRLNTAFADMIYHLSFGAIIPQGRGLIVAVLGLALVVLGALAIFWPSNQLDAFKQMLNPLWMELFGLTIALGGLGGAAAVSLIAWAKPKVQQTLGGWGISLVWGVGLILATIGGWFVFHSLDAHTIPTFMGLMVMHWLVVLGLVVVPIGLAMLPSRWALVTLFTFGSMVGAWLMMPPTTYLPKGNQNLVFGFMMAPPAYNLDHSRFIADRMERNMRPYWEAKSYEDLANQPPVMGFDFATMSMSPVPHVPPVQNFFFVSWSGRIFYGAMSADKSNVQPLEALLPWAAREIPGVIPLAFQTSIFGHGLGGTNAIDVDVIGDDMVQLQRSASALQNKLREVYGMMGVRPDPQNFDLPGPELQVTIDRVRAADLGVNVQDLGLGISALVDGLKVGDYRYKGDSIDLLLVRDPKISLTPDRLGEVPMAVVGSDGLWSSTPLASVADFVMTDSPQQINRVEQRRAITLTVVPPDNMPLEEAMSTIENMVEPMRAAGQIGRDIDVNLGGTADKLVEVREAMLGKWSGLDSFAHAKQTFQSLITSRLFLALLINYLLMCALFESWLYPFVIMFSVPLATIGGFLGLRITHEFVPTQLLDVLTMLGFVILIGTVVNNAILVVAQSLNFMRGFGESEQDVIERMEPHQAIRESVRTRMRPVMMTTLTTLFGLLPLVLKPGSGSEIYRGLGSVVLGGLLLSTLFTLLVVPILFSLTLDIKVWAYRKLGWPVSELGEGETLDAKPAADATH